MNKIVKALTASKQVAYGEKSPQKTTVTANFNKRAGYVSVIIPKRFWGFITEEGYFDIEADDLGRLILTPTHKKIKSPKSNDVPPFMK